MTQPTPPFGFFMGGEEFSDCLNMVSLVHGTGAVNDGLYPGYNVPAGVNGPDNGNDSTETVPQTKTFMNDADRPNSIDDYPVRQCTLTGYLGAPHAMGCVEGRWYLLRYIREPRSAKRYPPGR